ncbi:MAG: polysaccharide biosynthesis/export family protein, partial [Pseudomonadota bacterium]
MFLLLGLAGCATIPSAGPSASRIEAGAELPSGEFAYMLVDLDRDVSGFLKNFVPKSFAERFSTKHVHNHRQTIGVGDILNITVFEAGQGGLFSSETQRSQNFPAVTVSQTGQISLPYAGQITVDGDTPARVERKIVARLEEKAIQPQALVAISQNRSNAVVVGGDVRNPGRYPLGL